MPAIQAPSSSLFRPLVASGVMPPISDSGDGPFLVRIYWSVGSAQLGSRSRPPTPARARRGGMGGQTLQGCGSSIGPGLGSLPCSASLPCQSSVGVGVVNACCSVRSAVHCTLKRTTCMQHNLCLLSSLRCPWSRSLTHQCSRRWSLILSFYRHACVSSPQQLSARRHVNWRNQARTSAPIVPRSKSGLFSLSRMI